MTNPEPDGMPAYQPPDTPPQPTGTMPPLGGLGRRLAAQIIDWVILLVVAVPLSLISVFARHSDRDALGAVVEVVIGLVYFGYEGLMLTRAGGQTLGKKAMHIRVAVLADGSDPVGGIGWTRAAVWTLPGILCCGLWWVVDALSCVWDRPYQQAIHDKAARTVVVRTDWRPVG